MIPPKVLSRSLLTPDAHIFRRWKNSKNNKSSKSTTTAYALLAVRWFLLGVLGLSHSHTRWRCSGLSGLGEGAGEPWGDDHPAGAVTAIESGDRGNGRPDGRGEAMRSQDTTLVLSRHVPPRGWWPKRSRQTCLACSVTRPLIRDGLCDGCAMILEAWKRQRHPTTAAHLIELCAQGRARWGAETPMWRWPLFWWIELGWPVGPKVA